MRIKYIHKLEYKYEDPVQLGEHRLCIKPRSNGFQKLKNFELKITPEPEIIYPLLAASGEEINRIRFNGLTPQNDSGPTGPPCGRSIRTLCVHSQACRAQSFCSGPCS